MYFMISNIYLISSQCSFEIETTQLIFYANSLIALYVNMTPGIYPSSFDIW